MENKRIPVTELGPGHTVDQVFAVREKDLRTTKNGDYYISAILGDKTGGIQARMWRASEAVFNGIPGDGFVHVRGRVEDYRGNLQMVIDGIRPWPIEQVTLSDFIPTSDTDVEDMWAEMLTILRKIKAEPLRLLIKKYLEDHDLVTAIKASPAAVQMHHAYAGGLVEHTLGVVRAADALLPLYPELNGDLVLASAFLHDLAKCVELSGGVSLHYTDRGQLVGHIAIGCMWIQDKARLVAEEIGEAFPQRVIDVLQHILLAHHGVHEYGSPKLPAVPEAFFLHYLDNLDAKMWMTTHAIEDVPDPNASFTSYSRALETRLYRFSKHLCDPHDETQTGNLFL
jgi:3'-5' exoribonuclease